MSPRGPSWAFKRQTTAFKNPDKTRCFLTVLGPETSQDTLKNTRATQKAPKELQRPEQKSTKKNKKNAAVVKNALRWRSHFGPRMEAIFGDLSCSFLSSSFT